MTLGPLPSKTNLAAKTPGDSSSVEKNPEQTPAKTQSSAPAVQKLSQYFDKIEAALPKSWRAYPFIPKLLSGVETWTGKVLRLDAPTPPPPKSVGEQWLEALPQIMDHLHIVDFDVHYLRFSDNIVGNPEASKEFRDELMRFSEYQPKYLTDPITGEFLLDKDGNKIHAPPPKPSVIIPETVYGRAHFEVRPIVDKAGNPIIDPKDGSQLSLLTSAVLDYQGGEARKKLDPVPIGKKGRLKLDPGYLEVDCFTAVTPPTMTYNFGLGPNSVLTVGDDGDTKYGNACINRKPGEDVVTTPFDSVMLAPPKPKQGMNYDWMFYFQMIQDTAWQRFLNKYIDTKRGDKFLWANNPTFGFTDPEHFKKLGIRYNTWPRHPGDIARFFSPLFDKDQREELQSNSWFFNPNTHYLDRNHKVQKSPYDEKKREKLNAERRELGLPIVPAPRGPAVDWVFTSLINTLKAMMGTAEGKYSYAAFRGHFDPITFLKDLPIGNLRISPETDVQVRFAVEPVEETIDGQKIIRAREVLKVKLEPLSLGKDSKLKFGPYTLYIKDALAVDKIEFTIPWDQVYTNLAENKSILKPDIEGIRVEVAGLKGQALALINHETKYRISLDQFEIKEVSWNKLEASGESFSGLQLAGLTVNNFKFRDTLRRARPWERKEPLISLSNAEIQNLIMPTPGEDGKIKVVARGMKTWVTPEEKKEAEERGEEASSLAFNLPQFHLKTEQATIPKALFTMDPNSQALALRIPRIDSEGSLEWIPLENDKSKRPMEKLAMRGHSTLSGLVVKREVRDKETEYQLGFRYQGSIHETEFKSKLLAQNGGSGTAKLTMQEGETLHELNGSFRLKAQQPTDPDKKITTDYRLALNLPYAAIEIGAEENPVVVMKPDEETPPSTLRHAHLVLSPGKMHLDADVDIHAQELHAPDTELRFKGLTIEPHLYNVDVVGSLNLDLTPKGFKLENGGEIPLQANFELANSQFKHEPYSETELIENPERKVIGTNLKVDTAKVSLGHLQKLYFEKVPNGKGAITGRMTQLEAEDFMASGFEGGGEIWVYTFLWDWLPGVFPAFGKKSGETKRKPGWPKPPDPKTLVAHLDPEVQAELKSPSLPGGYKNFLRLAKISIGPSERYPEDPGLSDIYAEDFVGYARESGGNGQYIAFGIPDVSVKQVRRDPKDFESPVHRLVKNKGEIFLLGFLNNPDRHYSLKFISKTKTYRPSTSK